MFFMFINACFSLALSVGWVARRKDQDGLPVWAISLCIHGIASVLFALRGTIADFLSIVIANALMSTAYTLYYFAIATFLNRKTKAIYLAIPPILMAVIFSFLLHDLRARVIIGSSILLLQSVPIVVVLLRHPFDFPTRGRNLIIFALLASLPASLWRIFVGIFQPENIVSAFQSSGMQVATYTFLFVAIILISNGFLLMAKERSDEALRAVAVKDRLTGCWNRIRIEEAAEQDLARLKRYGYPAALLVLDIDHFKTINDRHGHLTGDAILREIGGILNHSVRTTDTVGRWGGEEFVVLLPSETFLEALHLAERIRRGVATHSFTNGIHVTVSIGVAMAYTAEHWTEWFARADAALYRAKEEGRDRVISDELDVQTEASDTGPPVHQLIWHDHFHTGNPQIDAEHSEIYHLANQFLRIAATAGQSAIHAAAMALIETLHRHFEAENKLLRATVKKDLKAVQDHLRQHAELYTHSSTLLKQYMFGEIDVTALVDFVVFNCVALHIQVEDIRIAPLLDHH